MAKTSTSEKRLSKMVDSKEMVLKEKDQDSAIVPLSFEDKQGKVFRNIVNCFRISVNFFRNLDNLF